MVIFDSNNPGEESDIVLCKQAIYLLGDPEDLMSFSKFKISVPAIRGARGTRPGSRFFQFHAVLGKFGEIVCWCPHPPKSWPHLREILDPPLSLFIRFATPNDYI